jgi:transposase
VPALPPYIIEPVWQQFSALLPEHKTDHPLGCHRSRIPERIVFEKLVQVLVFGCAYERIADASCSESTLRRRRDEWIELGVMERLRETCLAAYDRYIGLELSEVAVDCCVTKAPCGGEKAGRSPVDRGKRGLKRSAAVDAKGIPLGTVTAPANRHDSPLLVPTLDAVFEALGGLPEGASVHLDRAATTRASPASGFGSWACGGRSRGRVSRRRFGRRRGGWWRGRARGTTPTRSWCGARSGWGG